MKTAIPFLFFLVLVGVQSASEKNANFSERINLLDSESIKKHQPILIAHRGGVVTTEAPECSLEAIRLAAHRGYAMTELDVQESKDHVPVVFHDKNMLKACGIEGRIASKTVNELKALYFLKTGSREKSSQKICTLDRAFALCDELNLGVMLDIKDDGSEAFYQRIADGLVKYNLTKSTVTIADYPNVEKYLKGKTIFRISLEDVGKVDDQQPVNVKGKMWFGWPRHITNDRVKEFQKRGAIVIPSINVFHYPKDVHMERAFKDIERMKQAGVDAYQIDSVYGKFFQNF